MLSAIRSIGLKTFANLGGILPIAVIMGLILKFSQIIRNKIKPKEILYILIVCVYWIFMFKFALVRGKALYDRYLLFGYVMVLPFAAAVFTYYSNNYRIWVGMILIVVASFGALVLFCHPPSYVTRRQPTAIKDAAVWLKKSSYYGDPILLTRMGWQSTYFKLYLPEINQRCVTVSEYTTDSRLQHFLKIHKPPLLITRDGEDKYRSRIETILGERIPEDRLIYSKDNIKIYDIRDLLDQQTP